MRVPLRIGRIGVLGMWAILVSTIADAHPFTGSNAAFVQSVDGRAIGPFMYLGAKHMVTGYDHLLFLVGVIFFLYRLKDVVLYVSLFTLGHSVTLLSGVLGGIHANAYLVDAVIGASVVYKGFEPAVHARERRRKRSVGAIGFFAVVAPLVAFRIVGRAAVALPVKVVHHLAATRSGRATRRF